MQLELDVLRVPRGFMRILQFIFSIAAFASVTGFSTIFQYKVQCHEVNSDTHHTKTVAYPFRLDHLERDTACGGNFSTSFAGDFSSDAQFFVATGVLSMLYALASLAFYMLYDAMYQNDKTLPLIDFIVCMVLAVFWLSGSAAWSNGLMGLKYVCDPANWLHTIPYCTKNECASEFAGDFSSLNVSVILGFLNFFLWASNLWFVYKETAWFQPRPPPPGHNIQTPVA